MTEASSQLYGLRAIITQADLFMGPAIAQAFEAESARVTRDFGDPTEPDHADRLVATAGRIDVLIINLMSRNNRRTAEATDDADWHRMFDVMVNPMHRLVRAVLPQMLERRAGKIIVAGSANGLRGTAVRSAYSAARGAQIAFVRSVGVEVAAQGVCMNIIAQNWVSNPTSYPPVVTSAPEFQARLSEVPIGRIARGEESASLAVFLASREADFFVGQAIAFAGGWA